MSAGLTVLEFATKHADDCHCNTERTVHISADVDALIEVATASGKVLWQVVFDVDGRASLIWFPYPEEAWLALMGKAAQMQAIKSMLGLDS